MIYFLDQAQEWSSNAESISPLGEYLPNYDVASVLSGEADQLRIARKMQSILDNTYVEYYDNQYADDYP